MGNITIGGSKTLNITNTSSKSLIMPQQLQIVTTMQLTYSLVSSQWLFSLNGVTSSVKDLLDNGYTMQIQLIRERGYQRSAAPNYNLEGRQKKKPTYPSYVADFGGGGILEGKKARISINSFSSTIYQDMNLTTWMNNMFYYNSIIYPSTNKNPITGFIDSNGYWFMKLGFCILINNNKLATTSYITLNMKNNAQPINTNYTMTSNTIDIVAL
jgi:hypothetical protein